MIKVFTDGSANPHTGCGGWAAIIVDDNIKKTSYSGSVENTTNNRMELTALLSGLEWLKTNNVDSDNCILFTDSAYIHNCFIQRWYEKWLSNGWKTSSKKSVLNQDLWEKIIDIILKHGYLIEKIKAHSGIFFNEEVDKLAVNKRKELERNKNNENRY